MPTKVLPIVLPLLALLVITGCSGRLSPGVDVEIEIDPATLTDADGFTPIFNGKDLTGWTPKFANVPLGENYLDTFFVEDGVLKVQYDNYETFDGKFGHLFYDTPHSHYILRLEYRFTSDQLLNGAPGYTWINSGVMLHSQSAQSMSFAQEFPASVEAQMLGVPNGDTRDRPTANVCTPGTFLTYDGKLDYRHCISSTSDTFQGDQWITLEMEVRGHESMTFRINGQDVFHLTHPQLDATDGRDDFAAKKLIDARDGETKLSAGHIALQAEGAPLEFRNIKIKVLEE